MTTLHSTRNVGWGRRIAAFAGALLLAAAWGSVVQTQFNLQALVALDIDMPLQVRALTTLQDLAGFGPVYAGIVLAAWVPAFCVAAVLVRGWPRMRVAVYALAACVGVVVAIRTIDALAPMPVLIDATTPTHAASAYTATRMRGHPRTSTAATQNAGTQAASTMPA